jgi:hypothetical protein
MNEQTCINCKFCGEHTRSATLSSNKVIFIKCKRYPTETEHRPYDWCGEFELRPDSTPPEPQHGREPDKVKPLAQYLMEYIEHQAEIFNIESGMRLYAWDSWRELLEQALDAYQSTEQVKIRIKRV